MSPEIVARESTVAADSGAACALGRESNCPSDEDGTPTESRETRPAPAAPLGSWLEVREPSVAGSADIRRFPAVGLTESAFDGFRIPGFTD